MKSFLFMLISTSLLSMAFAHPAPTADESEALTNADEYTAADGLHFGDRLNVKREYEPTTPKDASQLYSLSYLESNFPEDPVQEGEIIYENDDSSESDEGQTIVLSKRNVVDDILTNKNFFDSIYMFSRPQRQTDGKEDSSARSEQPTIDLGQLIGAVESTLVHSAQNLASENVTVDANSTISKNTTEDEIVLPIEIPTPAAVDDLSTTTTSTATEKVHKRSPIDSASPSKTVAKGEFETIKPITPLNLSLLTPISFNAPREDDRNKLSPTTLNITHDDNSTNVHTSDLIEIGDKNVTLLATINATEIVPNDNNNVVHVQQQQITLFSANAGIFPSLPAIQVASLTSQIELDLTKVDNDCDKSSEESSSSSSEESSEESSSSEEKRASKCFSSSESITTTSQNSTKAN